MPLPSTDEALETLAAIPCGSTKGTDRDAVRTALIALAREDVTPAAIHKATGRTLSRDEIKIHAAAV